MELTLDAKRNPAFYGNHGYSMEEATDLNHTLDYS